ncbi:alpha/beta hydrolase [Pseudonocardia parietis]|uniref:Pimeloyl-ACP methyl ester carboxylesterase n=1 Tax=Pseudonocardia parietis TaxID=570936 RepID=A0ABS4VN08_9PSEU|nr:alpha/beta hydrolase [Pseudonocardia parietis]MBP2365310.1 pimeloyl-ACP methyl ester carboxylesterase [Pseudonocardia parietis]
MAGLILVSGCAGPAPQARADAPAPPPAELARFYDQEPTWGPCTDFATGEPDRAAFADPAYECARVEVPLNYEQPDGRTAALAMLRIAARDEPTGSLVFNAGGPGNPSTSTAVRAYADRLAVDPIGERFDFVAVDQRGTGASTPALNCFTDAEREDDAVTWPLRFGPDRTEAQNRELVERCAEGSGGMDVLAHSGSRDAARDMDVVRHVLGDEGLNYFGGSYGTRLGAVYAEMFPQNVRTMVLDGPLDPAKGTVERYLAQAASFQQGFDKLAASCATVPDCPLGTDPARATERFHQLVRPLQDTPATAPALGGRTLTYEDAVDAVMNGLYSDAAHPVIVQGLQQLATGRGDMLLALLDAFVERRPDGSYGEFLEANLAINCLDAQRRTPAEETAAKREFLRLAPFMDPGRPVVETRDRCEHWPVEPTLDIPFAQDIEGLPATLVVAATGDPATPYQDGINLTEDLGGHLLTVNADTHGSVLLGNSCIDTAVADYLISLETPVDGARCDG